MRFQRPPASAVLHYINILTSARKHRIININATTVMARTPSWLQINEENFKDLLDYLQENANNKDKDPFFAAACELL